MGILENIKHSFKNGNAITRLIFINAAVFVLLHIVLIAATLFNADASAFINYLALPADIYQLAGKPWTLITYMFLHQDFFHILFNMLTLYWFGKIFLFSFTEKQLTGLYLAGGLLAALFYILALNFFPYFEPVVPVTILMGASGSIMAVIIAAALRSPDLEVRLLLIGAVKMKYIALATVLISFFGITGKNAGGELAHLGGALCGYFFVVSLRKGNDITRWINFLLDKLTDLFRPRKLKTTGRKQNGARKMTDAEFNMNKARNMAEIDKILDKIKKSGYDSLSAEEKRKLFDQKK